jgi:hypothetical protein
MEGLGQKPYVLNMEGLGQKPYVLNMGFLGRIKGARASILVRWMEE